MRKKQLIWGYEDTRDDLYELKARFPRKTLSDILDECVKEKKERVNGKKPIFPRF